MTELRFYFDESVDLAVSEQLTLAGLDVVSAHSLDKLGDKDPNIFVGLPKWGACYAPVMPISWR